MELRTTRQQKTALLKSRCEPDLKREVGEVATKKGLDESDIIRLACRQFVWQHKQLHTPPASILINA